MQARTIYQIYPLGFTGAYPKNPTHLTDLMANDLQKTLFGAQPIYAKNKTIAFRQLTAWLPYIKKFGATDILLNPIFESVSHGYDTLNYYLIDKRLGTNAEFAKFVKKTHEFGLQVILDGVFNHVSNEFPLFQKALKGDEQAKAFFQWQDMDALTPQYFENQHELIQLNHENEDVQKYTIDIINYWLEQGVDGFRFDAAYAMNQNALGKIINELKRHEKSAKFYFGEVIHGDYVEFCENTYLDSLTQYELWKAVYSSINDKNFFELAWTIERQNAFLDYFIPQTFISNHDVSRLNTVITEKQHLKHAIVALFTLPGIPSVYAGDEFGATGEKIEDYHGDDCIRPQFPLSPPDDSSLKTAQLYEFYVSLIAFRTQNPWIQSAETKVLHKSNEIIVYETRNLQNSLTVCLNLSDETVNLHGITAEPHGYSLTLND
ncbi:MAG: alpha-amylase [Bifidobacteriaceae bacterium]|jgi:glycosidase|nr:alpha-amylase [Bifidobacteriaceae bacterium]